MFPQTLRLDVKGFGDVQKRLREAVPTPFKCFTIKDQPKEMGCNMILNASIVKYIYVLFVTLRTKEKLHIDYYELTTTQQWVSIHQMHENVSNQRQVNYTLNEPNVTPFFRFINCAIMSLSYAFSNWK